jgi:hypothetical protein
VIFVPFFFLGFAAFWVLTFVFWIMKIVEVARIPDGQFRAARTRWTEYRHAPPRND